MSQAHRSSQGSIIPTLFLGAGGTGSRIVDRIAARARRLPHWEAQLRPLTHFVTIDTNELDQHKLQWVPEGNRLNIAAFDKAKAIENFRRSKDAQALQWLDKAYQPRPGFKPGAGQIRVESRLGFFYHSGEIREQLRKIVVRSLKPNITWRQDNPPKFYVYLFCTLAGGTGSGSFLTLAYLVDEIIREQNWQPRIVGNLLLSSLMIDKVGPELHPDIHANTYAALKELEHLTKLDYAQVKREGRTHEDFVYCRNENRRDEISRVTSRPFFVSFIFDRPPHLGLPDIQGAIADAAYLQIFTPIMDNLAGELDNYEKHLEELTRFPGDLKNVGLGYAKNYGAYGAVALVLPGQDLLEYSALRFAAQAIRIQITFGVDPSHPDDDRARALAKLAIDYDDPKFLNMSDEGRERAIHKAFAQSVEELARQDARDELFDGYWYRLVETTSEGRATGTNEKGETVRAESQLARLHRELDESRVAVLNQVTMKERSFVFHEEGVNQYLEHVSRLGEEVRSAQRLVDEESRQLRTAAEEGEIITDLGLDPIHERFLVVRLLDLCQNVWLPEAERELEKAEKGGFSNPKVRDRLETELYQSLQEVARKKSFRKNQAFLDVRDQAQDEYRKVIKATRKAFDAQIRVRQLRGFLDYLGRRSRQYTRLATHMDHLVRDLERQADRFRRGEAEIVPRLTLRVEVFETLDEPRVRVWDEVYRHLYIAEGRSLSTFDRETLSKAITEELKPTIRADGKVVEKTIDQTVGDLRRALLDLGRERLAPAIFGGDGRPGLDLVEGLRLEAEIFYRSQKKAGEVVTDDELAEYQEKKLRALDQLAGVLARVNAAESKALDDGVKLNRTRQLIIHLGENGSQSSSQLLDRLKTILSSGGKQVKEDHDWHDPQIAIVHDVEMPMPLYYLEPVTREIEDAYLQVAAEERRSYQLHTDYNWEKSLPNLNPRRSELTVGWSLEALTAGLLTKVISRQGPSWVWHVGGPAAGNGDRHGNGDGGLKDGVPARELGANLSSALYRLSEIHHHEDLRKRLDHDLATGKARLDAGEEARRREKLEGTVRGWLDHMGFSEMDGGMSRKDALDRPVLRAVLEELRAGAPEEASTIPVTAKGGLYDSFSLD